jgi:integrator complex subunit 4
MNDELESVRLNAVQSLTKLATLTTLTQDMFIVLLQALDDPRGPLRRAVYALLAHARATDATCILLAVRRLTTALMVYPEDDAAVAAALTALGAHHSALTECLVNDLLGTINRSQCLVPDASLEQPAYKCGNPRLSSALESPTSLLGMRVFGRVREPFLQLTEHIARS